MEEVRSLLRSMGKDGQLKEARVHNIRSILLLLNQELKVLQEEDKNLMRQFQEIRRGINLMKEFEEEHAFERSYSLLTPRRLKNSDKEQRSYSIVFDVTVETSDNAPRRRAFSEKI